MMNYQILEQAVVWESKMFQNPHKSQMDWEKDIAIAANLFKWCGVKQHSQNEK